MNLISCQPARAASDAAAAAAPAASSSFEAVACSEDGVVESTCESAILALDAQLLN